jgi:SAM-dependent methyltransferase
MKADLIAENDEQDTAVFVGTERFSRPGCTASLTTEWVAARPKAAARLAAGGLVAAVGCGHGGAAIMLARAFPQASIYGYDFHERSIQVARQRAAEAGLGDRIRFEPLGATTYPVHGFDLICLLDTLHDLGDPGAALAHARNAVAPGGAVLVVEPAADDGYASSPARPLTAFACAASTFQGTPAAPARAGGVALGAPAGPAAARQLARDAGFSGFRIVAQTPVSVIFELRP